MKTRSDALVFMSCVLLAICFSGPVIEQVDRILSRHPIHSAVPAVVLAPFGLMWFLDYAFGVGIAAILSVCVLFVLFRRDVQAWKKLLLSLASVAVWPILLPWIERSNHLW
jgi:hypothetical protein